MRLNILCTDEDLAAVKVTAGKETILNTPVSADGKEPITHWYCFMNVSQAKFDYYTGLQDLTIMEEMDSKSFLAKHNLKIVRRNYNRVSNNRWS